jgi:excisionase family DNA binding protein
MSTATASTDSAKRVDEVRPLLGENGKLLVSLKEAAHLLSISTRTLNRMVADGSIPYVKIGKRTLFSITSLEDYIERAEAGDSGDAVRESEAAIQRLALAQKEEALKSLELTNQRAQWLDLETKRQSAMFEDYQRATKQKTHDLTDTRSEAEDSLSPAEKRAYL